MNLSSFYILFMLPVASLPSPGWEVVAETYDCPVKAIIEAKEGENIIHANVNGKKINLYAQGNYVYLERNPVPMLFDSITENDEEARYQYLQHPPGGENYLFKIITRYSVTTCEMFRR